MNDYDITFDKNQVKITEIKNKELGLIRFTSQKIDEECGYVRGSQIVIYSSVFKQDMLNLLHIHINDMSEQVSVDVAYMQDDQGLHEFQTFNVDVTGQILRYKIMVKDMRIFTILYNDGNGQIEELPFEEIRMNQGDLIMVNPSQEIAYSTQPMLARIDHIPINMIASKDKEKLSGIVQDRLNYNMTGFCKQRFFERLPGFIDVSLLSLDNCKTLVPDSSLSIAVPVCNCSFPDEMQMTFFQSLMDQKLFEENSRMKDAVNVFEELVNNYEQNEKEICRDMESMQNILHKLQVQENELE